MPLLSELWTHLSSLSHWWGARDVKWLVRPKKGKVRSAKNLLRRWRVVRENARGPKSPVKYSLPFLDRIDPFTTLTSQIFIFTSLSSASSFFLIECLLFIEGMRFSVNNKRWTVMVLINLPIYLTQSYLIKRLYHEAVWSQATTSESICMQQ